MTNVILTAEKLQDVHPELPEDFRKSMASIQVDGGPWDCKACGGPSYLCYRCSKCGADLVGEKDGVGASSQGGSL